MKIVRELVPEITLSAFADEHNLTMKVVERRKEYSTPDARFYASFDYAEVGGNGMLRGVYGNGATEAEAIEAYGTEISEKLLIVRAYYDDRREIRVPRLVPEAE